MCCFPLLFLVYLCDSHFSIFFFFNDPATTEIYTLSLHDALLIAVLRSAPSTFCPLPVCRRYMRAASVPSAACEAVPQSTQATAARRGCSGVPVRYDDPHITWPMPSKPCLALHGPPAP